MSLFRKRSSFFARCPGLSRRRASALITVCIFSALVLLIAVGSITSITFGSRSTGRSLAYKQSIALAEAGAEVALAQLNIKGNSWTGWTSSGSNQLLANQSLTDSDGRVVGTYTVTVINAASDEPLIDSVGKASIGNTGEVSRTVRVPVKNNTKPSGFGSYGIFSKTSIDFGNNNKMRGAAAAIGDIYIKNPAEMGAVQAGGQITGKKLPEDRVEGVMPTLPPAYPDDELAAAKTDNDNEQIYKKDGKGNTIPLNVPTNGDFDFEKHGTIYFPEGTYYLDHLKISSNTDIKVDGPVKLYMDPGIGEAAIDMASGRNTINDEGNPTDLKIFVKSGTVTFGSNFSMWAGLYCQDAELAHFASNTWLYGAIVANEISLAANSGIYTDGGLLAPESDEGYLAQGWTEYVAN